MNEIDLIETSGNRNMCFPNVRFTMRIAFAQPITAAIGKGGFWFEGEPKIKGKPPWPSAHLQS